MGDYLKIVIEHLELGIKHKKCWQCGCQQNTVNAIAESLPSFNDEDRKIISPLLERGKATFDPVQYDCLGCKLCFPAVVTNELTQAYPALALEGESCGPAVADDTERSGWPPWPGNYVVQRYQAPVAVCALNSKNLVPEIAGFENPSLGIVGTLNTENLGIERIIKNVTGNPHLRFLILCGEDSEQQIGHLPGQSLASLFRNGMDEKSRIIGAQGRRPVLKNVSTELVEQFRRQVELVSMIGCAISSNVLQIVDHCGEKNPGKFNGGSVMPIEIPRIQAQAPKSLVMDPNGYFVIFLDRAQGSIMVEHYKNNGTLNQIIEGEDISHIYMTAIELGLLSRLDHACYFGKELARAETSLQTGAAYLQDKAQDKSEATTKPDCKASGCC